MWEVTLFTGPLDYCRRRQHKQHSYLDYNSQHQTCWKLVLELWLSASPPNNAITECSYQKCYLHHLGSTAYKILPTSTPSHILYMYMWRERINVYYKVSQANNHNKNIDLYCTRYWFYVQWNVIGRM